MHERPTWTVGKTALVVDDDKNISEFVCTALTDELGMLVATSSDGIDAIQRATDLKPDLMVVDIRLPGIDGLEVARRLGAYPATAGIPILAVSANARHAPAIEAGCREFLAKPFDLAEFVNTVARMLRPADDPPA